MTTHNDVPNELVLTSSIRSLGFRYIPAPHFRAFRFESLTTRATMLPSIRTIRLPELDYFMPSAGWRVNQ
jgi:hypothetical protein